MKLRAAILALSVSLLSMPALAEQFYVELGRAKTEAEAKTVWDDLETKHTFLKKYDVYPNQILQADDTFVYRIQAGPMPTKVEADRICRRLFRRQISCFVIEGFDPKNAQTFAAQPTAPQGGLGIGDFLPWLSSAPTTPPPPAIVEAPVIVEAEPKKLEPATDSKAKVDVAEAIPVPVTENVEVSAPVPIYSTDSTPEIKEEVKPAAVSGWISIQPFLDEGRAKNFWSELKSSAPSSRTKGLNIQTIRPVVAHDIPKIILAVGSFPSEAEATQFCKDFVPSSTYLECQFAPQPPDGDVVHPGEARKLFKAAPKEEYSLFWVEVLNERSQNKALEKWEKIRTDNDDLLANVRSQITASFNNPGVYVVKIGPLKTRSKAQELCDSLKTRNIGCTLSSL